MMTIEFRINVLAFLFYSKNLDSIYLQHLFIWNYLCTFLFNFMKIPTITLYFYNCQKSEININSEGGKQLWMKQNEGYQNMYVR